MHLTFLWFEAVLLTVVSTVARTNENEPISDGNTGYSTLSAAITAVNTVADDTTLTVNAPIKVSEAITITNDQATITLDMNKHNFMASVETVDENSRRTEGFPLNLEAGASLVIEGEGSVFLLDSTITAGGFIQINHAAKSLTINKGSWMGQPTQTAAFFYVQSIHSEHPDEADITAPGCTITLNDLEAECSADVFSTDLSRDAKVVLTVSGGRYIRDFPAQSATVGGEADTLFYCYGIWATFTNVYMYANRGPCVRTARQVWPEIQDYSGSAYEEVGGAPGTILAEGNNFTTTLALDNYTSGSDSAVAVTRMGRMHISGGTYTGARYSIYAGDRGGCVKVSGGTFIGGTAALYSAPLDEMYHANHPSGTEWDIEGGTFVGPMQHAVTHYSYMKWTGVGADSVKTMELVADDEMFMMDITGDVIVKGSDISKGLLVKRCSELITTPSNGFVTVGGGEAAFTTMTINIPSAATDQYESSSDKTEKPSFYASAGTLVFTTVAFIGSANGLSQSVISSAGASLKLNSVSFNTFTLTGTAGLLSINTASRDNFIMTGTNTFTSITTASASASVFILDNPTAVTIGPATFTSCSGTKAAAVSITNLDDLSKVSWDSVQFITCTQDAYVYAETTSDLSATASSAWANLLKYDETKATAFQLYYGSSTNFIPSGTYAVVSPSGNNDNECSTTSLQCATIAGALTKVSSATIVALTDGVHPHSTQATISSALTVSGEGRSLTTLSVDSITNGDFIVSGSVTVKFTEMTIALAASQANPVFNTSATALSIDRVEFVMKDAETTIASPIISASTGAVLLTSATFTSLSVTASGASLIDTSAASLTLSAVTFDTITLTAAPLLKINPSSFSLTATTFSSVINSGGNGAVFSITQSGDLDWTVPAATFTNCKAQLGGALYFSLTGSLSQVSLKWSDGISFTNCFATGGYGNNILISYPETTGSKTISTDNLPDAVYNTDYMHVDSTGTYATFKAPSDVTTRYIDERYGEDVHCASSLGPCRSFAGFSTDLTSTTQIKILSCNADIKPFTITSGLTIQGDSSLRESRNLYIGKVDSFEYAYTITDTGSLTLSSATFVPSDAESAGLVTMSGTSPALSMTSVDVVASDTSSAFSKSLVNAGSGTVTLTSCLFNALTFSEEVSAFVISAGASLSIAACTFDTIQSSAPLIDLAATATLTMTRETNQALNSFASIQRTGTEGVILSLRLSSSVSLKFQHAVVVNCRSSEEGKVAPALSITLPDSDQGALLFSDVIFLYKSTQPNGWSSKDEHAVQFIASSLSVLQGNVNTYDSSNNKITTTLSSVLSQIETAWAAKMYLYYGFVPTMYSLSHLVSDTELFKSDIMYLSEEGADTSTCGWAEHPCKTINQALSVSSTTESVYLAPGTYTETVDLTFDHSITFTGEGADRTEQKITLSEKTFTVSITADHEAITVGFIKASFVIDTTSAQPAKAYFTIVQASPASATHTNTGNGDMTLSFSDVQISAKAESLALTKPVVSASAGLLQFTSTTIEGLSFDEGQSCIVTTGTASLTLDYATFQKIEMNNKPLIDLSLTASPILSGAFQNTFTAITRSSGNGAVFSITTDGVLPTLSISPTSFNNCSSTDSDAEGGAIYIKTTDASALTFTEQWVSFFGCSSGSGKGDAILIDLGTEGNYEGKLPHTYVTIQIPDTDITYNQDTLSHTGISYKDYQVRYNSNQYYTFLTADAPGENTVFVDPHQDGAEACTANSVTGCHTLLGAAKLIQAGSATKIVLAVTTHTQVSTQIDFTSDATINGARQYDRGHVFLPVGQCETTGSMSNEVADAALKVDGSGVTLTLAFFTVHIVSTTGTGGAPLTHPLLLSTGGSKLSLSFVVISVPDSYSEGLTKTTIASHLMESGTELKMETVLISDLTFSSTNSLISSPSGNVKLLGCAFRDITLDDAPLLSITTESNALTFGLSQIYQEATSFARITRSTAGGAVLDLTTFTTGHQLSLNYASFSDCGKVDNDAVSAAVSITLTGAGGSFSKGMLYTVAAPHRYGFLFKGTRTVVLGYELEKTFDTTLASYSADNVEKYYVSLTDDPEYSGPLAYLYAPPTSVPSATLYVQYAATAPAEEVFSTCGWKELPCLLISTAYAAVTGTTFTTVHYEYSDTAYPLSSLSRSVQKSVVFDGAHDTPNVAFLISGSALDASAPIVSIKPAQVSESITVTYQKLNFNIQRAATDTNFDKAVFLLEKNGAASAKLVLDTVTITGVDASGDANGNVAALSSAVVNAVDGQLVLNSVTFTKLSMGSESPLLRVPVASGAFSMTGDNEFNTITRTGGNGAVFAESLDGSSALSIENAVFKGCSSALGVMAFTITSPTAASAISIADGFTDSGETTVSYTQSDGSTITWSDATVCAVGFVAAQATYLEQAGNFIAGSTAAKDYTTEGKYYASIASRTALDLKHYVDVPAADSDSIDLAVSSSGLDFSACGSATVNCLTIPRAASVIAGITATTKTITVAEASDYDMSVIQGTIATSVTVQATTQDTVTITVSPSEQLSNDVLVVRATSGNIAATITKINFYVDCPTTNYFDKALFTVQDNQGTTELSLNTVKIIGGTAAAGGTRMNGSPNTQPLTSSLINAISGKLTMNNVQFTTIDISGHPLISASQKQSYLSMTSVSFTSIVRKDTVTSESGASVFSFTGIGSDSYITLAGATFASCTGASDGLGGVVYLQVITTPPTAAQITFDSKPFTGETAQSTGHYIYIDASSATAATFATVHRLALQDLYPVNPATGYYMYKGNDGTVGELSAAVPTSLLSITMAADGTCTVSDNTATCTNLYTAFGLFSSNGLSTGNEITFTVEGAVTGIDDSNHVGLTKGVVVQGYSSSSHNTLAVSAISSTPLISLTTPATGLIVFSLQYIDFAISSSATGTTALANPIISIAKDTEAGTVQLSLSDLTISSDTDTCQADTSIISASKGKLTLSGVTFASITLSDAPLLDVASSSEGLTLGVSGQTVNTFSSITRTTGSGAVFSLTAVAAGGVAIQNSRFILCQTSSLGGAIYAEGLTAANAVTLDQSTVTFSGCKATSGGHNVYLKADDTDTGNAVTATSVKTVWDAVQEMSAIYYVNNDYLVQPQSGDAAPIYTSTATNTIFIDSLRGATDSCGLSTNIPCATINQGLTANSGLSDVLLVPGEHSAETNPVSIAKAMTIRGTALDEVTKAVGSVTEAGARLSNAVTSVFDIKVTEALEVSIQQITFSLEASLTVPAFLLSAAGTLALSNIHFAMASGAATIASTIVRATAGTLSLTTVSATDVTLTSHCLFDLSGISTLAMADTASSACVFTSITSTSGTTAAVFSLHIPSSLSATIRNAVFSNCIASSGKASALYIQPTDLTSTITASNLVYNLNAPTHSNEASLPLVHVHCPSTQYISAHVPSLKKLYDGNEATATYYVYSTDGTTKYDISGLVTTTSYAVDQSASAGCTIADATGKSTCKTLSEATTTAAAADVHSITLTANNAYTTTTLATTIADSVTVTGTTSTEATAGALSDTCFTVSAGSYTVTISTLGLTIDNAAAQLLTSASTETVTLNTLHVTTDNPSTTKLTNSLITATAGTIKLISTEFQSITMADSSTVSLIDTSTTAQLALETVEFNTITLVDAPLLKIQGVADGVSFTAGTTNTFTTIVRSTGNGAVLAVSVAGAFPAIALGPASFTSCQSTGAGSEGGAIYFAATAFDSLTFVSEISFSDCSSESGKGRAILLDAGSAASAPTVHASAANIKKNIDILSIDFQIKYNSGAGYSPFATQTVTANTLYVDPTQADETGCVAGQGTGCKTLASAKAQLSANTVVNIKLAPTTHTAVTGTALTLDVDNTQIFGSSATLTILPVETISTDPIFTITAGVTVERLTFTLADALASSVFSVTTLSSSLTLRSVVFAMADGATSIGATALSVSAGTLTLSAVTATNIEVASASFITVAGGASLTMNMGCSFEGVTRSGSGDGGVVSMELASGASLSVLQASFTSCSAPGNGGVFAISVTTGGSISLGGTSLSFTSCGAGASGCGGGIYISAAAPLTGLSVGTVTFTTPGTAKNGSCIYYTATTLGTYLDSAKAALLACGTEGEDKDQNKYVYKHCGGEDTDMWSWAAPASFASVSLDGAEAVSYPSLSLGVTAAEATLSVSSSLVITLLADYNDFTYGDTAAAFVKTTKLDGDSKTLTLSTKMTDDVFTVGKAESTTALSVENLVIAVIADGTNEENTLPGSLFVLMPSTSVSLSLDTVTVKGVDGVGANSAAHFSKSVIDAVNGQLSLTACTFQYISLSALPLLSVGPSSGQFSIATTKGDGSAAAATAFTAIERVETSAGDGGAVLSLTLGSGDALSLTNAAFHGCTVSSSTALTFKAGAIYLNVNHDSASVSGASLTFDDTSAPSADQATVTAKYLYVTCSQAFADANGRELKSLTDSSVDPLQFYYFVDDEHNGAINTLTSVYYVETGGDDANLCTASAKCLTLSRAESLAKSDGQTKQSINIAASTTVSDASAKITSLNRDLTITGAGADETLTTLSYVETSSFPVISFDAGSTGVQLSLSTLKFSLGFASGDVSGGLIVLDGTTPSLTLNTITIDGTTAYAESKSFTTVAMIVGSAGTLSFTSVSVQSIKLSNVPLISLSAGGSLTFASGNTFNAVERDTGDGALLQATLSSSTQLSLSGATFTNCIATAGTALFAISVTAGAEQITLPDPSTAYTRGAVNAHTAAALFTAAAHSTLIPDRTVDTTLFSLEDYKNDANSLYYAQVSTYPLDIVLHYAATPISQSQTTLYVSKAANTPSPTDVSTCGWEDLPCDTVTNVLGLTDYNAEIIEIIAGTDYISTQLKASISVATTIQGAVTKDAGTGAITSLDVTAQQDETDFFAVTAAVSVGIKNMNIEINSAAGKLVSSSVASSITLTYLVITLKSGFVSSLTNELFAVTSGSLVLSKVSVTGVTLTSKSLISDSLTSLTINSGSSFTSITKDTSGNGAVVEMTVGEGKSVSISECTFTSCSAAGTGGALALTQSSIGTVSIGESGKITLFSGCKAGTTGGAIWVSVADKTKITFDTVTYSDLDATSTATTGLATTAPYVYYLSTVDSDGNIDSNLAKAIIGVSLGYVDGKNAFVYQDQGKTDTNMRTLAPATYYILSSSGETDATCRSKTESTCVTYASAIVTATTGFITGDTVSLVYTPAGLSADDVFGSTVTTISQTVTLQGTDNGEAGDDLKYTSLNVQSRTAALFDLSESASEYTLKIKQLNFVLALTGTYSTSAIFTLSGTSSQAQLSLDTVTFARSEGERNTEVPLGQPAISASTGTVTLSSVSAENIKLTSQSLISGAPTSLTMSGCSFTSITKETSGNGAVVEMTVGEGQTLIIDSTDFIKCSSATNGGALAITQESTGKVVLGDASKAVTFTDCTVADTTDGMGASLYLSVAKYFVEADDNGVLIQLVSFAEEDVSITVGNNKGKYMYYESTDPAADVDFSSASATFSLVSSASDNEFVYKSSASVVTSLFIAHNIRVTIGGAASEYSTLSGAITAINGAADTTTVTLLEPLTDPTATTAITHSCTIQPESDQTLTFTQETTNTVFTIGSAAAAALDVGVTGLTIELTADGTTSGSVGASLFNLALGQNDAKSKLTLNQVTIESSDATPNQAVIAAPLIDASNGQLDLKQCTFRYITVTANSLLSVSSAASADLSFSNSLTTFTSILRSNAGASVFAVSLSSSFNLDLTNAKFDGCGAVAGVSGNAGAIKVTLTSSVGSFTTGTFDNVVAGLKYAILFESASFTNFATNKDVLSSALASDLSSHSTESEQKHRITITAGYEGYLSHLLKPATWKAATTELIIAVDGYDATAYPTCGWTDLPCSSLSGLMTAYSQGDLTGKTATFRKGTYPVAQLTSSSSLSFSLTLSGELDDGAVAVSVTNCDTDYSVDYSAQVKIEQLAVAVDESESPFLTTRGETTLANITFGNAAALSASTMTGSLLVVKDRKLTLNAVSVYWIETDDALVRVSEGSFSASGDSVASKAVFSHITTDGGVIQATLSKDNSLEVSNAEFISCTSTTAAGALAILVDEKSDQPSLTLTTVAFKGCSFTKSTTALASALYLHVDGDTLTLSTSGLSFSQTPSSSSSAFTNADPSTTPFVYVRATSTFVQTSTMDIRALVPTADTTTDAKAYYKIRIDNAAIQNIVDLPVQYLVAADDGSDNNDCYTQACKTLKKASSLSGASLIKVEEGEYGTSSLEMDLSRDLVVAGTGEGGFSLESPTSNTLGIVQVTGAATVTLSSIGIGVGYEYKVPIIYSSTTATLTLLSIYFTSTLAAGKSLQKSFVSAVSGTLIIRKSEGMDMIMNDSPLISCASTLVLSDFEVTGISRNSGNGAVLEWTATSGSLTMEACVFERCSASEGSGGALALTQAGSTSISLTEIRFYACTATKNGGSIYLRVADKSYITFKQVTYRNRDSDGTAVDGPLATDDGQFVYYAPTADAGKLEHPDTLARGIIGSANDEEVADKIAFAYLNGNTVEDMTDYVPNIFFIAADPKGDDTKCTDRHTTTCTSYAAVADSGHRPRLSAKDTIYIIDDAEGTSIFGTEGTDITLTLTLSSDYTITADNTHTKALIRVAPSSSAVELTVEDFQFSLGAIQYPVFSVSNSASNTAATGSLVLTSVTFRPNEGDLKSAVITGESGSITLSHVTTNGIELESSSFITSLGATVTVADSSFSGITRNQGSGAAVQIKVVGSLTIRDTDFSSCTCRNGSGGAVAVTMMSGSSLALTSVTFTSCTATLTTASATRSNELTSSPASGQAVFLYIAEKPAAGGVSINTVMFEDCNSESEDGSTSTTSDTGLFVASSDESYLTSKSVWENTDFDTITTIDEEGAASTGTLTAAVVEATVDKDTGAVTADTITVKKEVKASAIGSVDDTKTKEPEDDKSYWWIVFPILAFAIIIVVLVILDYILVCRKEQEGDKATKYEEGGEKTEEMETSKFEEETESELALVTVPSVSEKPNEEEETNTSEESKSEETKAEEPTTETTSSSSTTPSTSEAPATESSTSSSTESSPSESSSLAEASSSTAAASSSSSSESTPSESSATESSSTEATSTASAETSSTSSGSESSPSQPSEPSAQSEPPQPTSQSEPSPKEESSSSSSPGESSETVPQSSEPSVENQEK